MVSRRTTGRLLLATFLPWKCHVIAWAPSSLSRSHQRVTSRVSLAYGRGAEIWPPGSEDTVIRLSDSFPGGVLPPTAINLLQPPLLSASTTSWRARWARALAPWWMGWMVVLPCVKCLRPLDLLLVAFLSGYIIVLQRLSSLQDTDAPVLAALPPQGHVPWLVQHPLGYDLTHSWMYTQWLRLGFALGVVVPVLCLAWTSVIRPTSAMASTGHMLARPLFLLACQIVTETIQGRITTPLPLRILVPVAYNTVRLGYLWQSVTQTFVTAVPLAIRLVAVSNLIYWSTNLFAFLIPVAVIRYMRAHFFAVEASHVTTHSR